VGFQLAVSLSIIFVILHLRLVRPLRRLARHSDLLAGWQLEESFDWKGRDELGELGQSLERTRLSLLDLVRALEDKNEELTRLNQGLKNALAARSVFLANMSHELRTPLNSIIGFSTVLLRRLEGEIEPRHLGFLRNILGSGENLLRLVNDVLDLSRIEAGKMELVLEPVNVREALEGIRRVIQRAAERKHMEVELEIASDVPVILADSGKFKQVVYHLLSNAVKFSHENSAVGIRVTRLAADDEPLHVDAVRIDVVDHGIGIAAANHEVVFEEFRQLDGSPSRMYEGTGLGLALVKKLLELHGGEIRIDSELGQGSTFSVFLPTMPAPGAEVRDDTPTSDSGRHPALGSPGIGG
jgi:signal transduction histidine kinase